MSGRRASDRNRIRGPQSALTDFLAANQISAQQIRDSYEQRNREAEERNAAEAAARSTAASPYDEVNNDDSDSEDSQTQSKKRKRAESKSKAKGKPGKTPKKTKGKKQGSDDEFDVASSDNDLGRDMYKKSRPNPGQLENCEICAKRFTVTAYSKTGPDGGLVCSPCGRDLAKDDVKSAKKPQKTALGKARRKVESNRLDGLVSGGAKTLQQLCIEKVADHHLDIDEFGDLPDSVLNRVSQIFSKRRVMDPRTMRLFLRPDLDTVAIYDCANLEVADYKQIFAIVPQLQKLVLQNACQFKDTVVEYMLERTPNLSHFHVYAANLITNDMWKTFFQHHGAKLEVLKLASLDASFDDEVVACMVQHCTNLRQLKLKDCRKITSASLLLVANLKTLTRLSLRVAQTADAEQLVPLIESLGHNLKTFSLEDYTDANDAIVGAIRTHCQHLSKFRLTGIDCITDAALTSLLSPPSPVPPLSFVDLSGARDVDNNNPSGTAENPIGLASDSFRALMAYHGIKLQRLHLASCRHISHHAFWDAFVGNGSPPAAANKGPQKNDEGSLEFPITYPELRELNISFCNDVDTSIINGIFRSCPNLAKLIAFGCFKIEDVTVPKGVALIGVPRAQDAIEQFGAAFDAAAVDGFLSELNGVPSAGMVEVVG